MWIKLVSTVIHVVLVETEDQFVWRVNEKLGFSVKSMYRDLLLSNSLPERNVSWKIKVPLKIKIFLWYLKKRVILTGDNLAKRNWKGGKSVVSAILMKPSNIFSLNVMLLSLCGMPCFILLALQEMW